MKNIIIIIIIIGLFSASFCNNCYAAFPVNPKTNCTTTKVIVSEQDNHKRIFSNGHLLTLKEYFNKKNETIKFLKKEKLRETESGSIDGDVILSWISIALSITSYILLFFEETLVVGICLAIADGIFTLIAVHVDDMDSLKVFGYIADILVFPLWCLGWIVLHWWN